MRLPPGTELSASVLLFDMDGTLIDSNAVVRGIWRRFAERHRLDLEPIMRMQHGRRTVESVSHFTHLGIDVDAEAERLSREEREEMDGIVEVPGARALLQSLPPDRWAVVTSAERELAVKRFGAAGLPLPRVLVSAEDVLRGKPDPTCYLRGAELMGVAAALCLVFEDAPFGLQAGHAAGARVVALTTNLSETDLGAEDSLADYRNVRAATDGDRVVLRVS